MLNLKFSDAKDAACSIRDQQFGGFNCLPFNRFSAANSETWWITPGRERSAFPYAKAIFTTNPDWTGAGDIFSGLNVEKGVSQVSNLPSSNVMNTDWFWYTFLDRKQLSLESVLAEARQNTTEDLQVLVASCLLEGSDRWELLWFQVDGHELKQTEYHRADGTLSGVASVTDLASLTERLSDLNREAWHWVDVLIGQSFSLDRQASDDSAICGAMLKAFKPWMQKSAAKAT